MEKRHQLMVVVEGGVVQAIVSTKPELFADIDVVVVDYDTEGADENDLSSVQRDDGSTQPAFVSLRDVELSTIGVEIPQ